ncbi:MAG: preprotein translocase subunit SecA, partial [Bacteroidota bacterium]
QKKVEENNFGSRKRLLEYDDVMNAQRSGIYRRRRNALSGERLALDLANSVYDAAEALVNGSKPSRDFGAYELGCFENFAMTPPVDAAEFERLSAVELAQKTYAAAQAAYRAKCDRIAAQALPVLENVLREQGSQFQNILVPFTDGIKSIQIPTNLQRGVETRGQSLTTDLEKAIVLSIIDEHWKEHLRNMDDLRQNVQGAVYEQKDPLLVYKHESFKLFKDMVDEMNSSILGFLFRAGLPQADPGQAPVRQAPSAPARPAPKLTTSGPGADEAPAARGTASRSATPPPSPAPKQAPAVSSKKYGRNDQVTVVNLMTGEQKQVKFKVAEPLLAQGWQILN